MPIIASNLIPPPQIPRDPPIHEHTIVIYHAPRIVRQLPQHGAVVQPLAAVEENPVVAAQHSFGEQQGVRVTDEDARQGGQQGPGPKLESMSGRGPGGVELFKKRCILLSASPQTWTVWFTHAE
jgi:hypothetical protein